MKKVLSGIQTSGRLTLGNYIGAIKNFVKLQETHDSYFMLADLHAVTVQQEPTALQSYIEEVALLYVASGLDPEKSTIFMQSSVPSHAEMGWLLTTMTYIGELERMTQFKDKSLGKDSVGAGLFTYPALQAADILLYNPDLVPIGEDQKQHVELTRDIGHRFNTRYGDLFTLPEPLIQKTGARIMSLDDPSKKMSKSNPNPASYILMLDPPDVIRKKVSRAVTDSGRDVKYDPATKPEISNLMTIYTHCSDMSFADIEAKYEGQGYGNFKKDLAEVIVATLSPIQQRCEELRRSGSIYDILRKGAKEAEAVARPVLLEAKKRMGFINL
ncbi:MAG: tryptophan--tRNA ligase [Gorillibacterium sp.]|nr:tryptophan--tRNA ligase [Gorillibacterium sp.]